MDYYKIRDELNFNYDPYQLLAVGASQVKFYQGTNCYLALCPFHNDSHLGSFSFNAQTKIWKCFSCGRGGHGVIDFVMAVNGWSFKEAIQFLWDHKDNPVSPPNNPPASLWRGIKKKNYQALLRPRASSARIPPPYYENLSAEELDRIYRAFAAGSPLTEEEKEKLCKVRGLKMDSTNCFFRFPGVANSEFWRFLKQELGPNNLYNKLLGVPGFYWDKFEDQVKFIGQRNSLGILNHDFQGRVNGIEIRLKNPQTGARYIPFSSANRPYGTKQKSWVDFVPASQSASIGLAVTEGKYKALHLSYAGYDALNIHSIANWREALKVLNNHDIKDPIHIAFDADSRSKASVALQTMQFGEALLNAGYEVQYLVWPEEHGKGFDDLCNAGFRQDATLVPAEEYLEKTLRPVVAQLVG